MRPTFRKLEIKDVRDVEKLVTENAENIEPGLKIIDSCIMLGHARIDLVGVDAKDSLVLTTLGFTANEEMLLRALEAYSWCLEFPETVRRLYPRTHFKPGRAPRMIFIAERIGDGFLRKARQLAFRELDCLTFLYLDVNGAPAVYFDAVERIRRGAEDPLMEQTPIIPDLPMDQHPFIEGAPPERAWDDPDGNGAWQTRIAESQRAEDANLSRLDSLGVPWTDPAPVAASAPLDASLITPPPDATMPMDDATPAGDEAAGRPDNLEQYKGEWREFLDRLGAATLPQSGKLSRNSQGFVNQFGPSE
ncbi:MAG: hypothetical protein HY359_06455 [Candidatus Rokubacteria bacterium]|nr:hypothetical protein [Candidatus Rokubacteria bacterium]